MVDDVYLSKQDSLGISLLRKQGSPCLLRGSLAYIFSDLLTCMWVQYVKWVVFSCTKISYVLWEIKGSENFF